MLTRHLVQAKLKTWTKQGCRRTAAQASAAKKSEWRALLEKQLNLTARLERRIR